MTITTINPANEQVLQVYQTMDQDQVESILASMESDRQQWSKQSFAHRAQCMHNLAELLRRNTNKYAQIITKEMGKPITLAEGEIEKCIWLCEHYAEHAEGYLQDEVIATEKSKSYKCYKPLGIIFAIMPWNFPFWQVLRFAVPNLMAGNGGLLKHAPNCTGAALAIAELFQQAGFPANLFQSLVIDVDLAGFVIKHPLVAGVTLTGSERAGQAVSAQAGQALKKVVMELGGSDPYLILDDADLDLAASQCAKSRLNNAGQVCISAKRIIVVDSVREQFQAKLLEQVQAFQCGDPADPNTTMGPMARDDLRQQLHQQVTRSIASGARCIQGGHMIDDMGGFYYPPTVLFDVTPGMPAYDEELFGPVVCVINARDESEAIAMANDSPYGLGAAVFTKDVSRGEQIARDSLHAGTCSVNALVGSDPRLPFGGIKNSGYGRELSAEGIREFTNIKTVLVQ